VLLLLLAFDATGRSPGNINVSKLKGLRKANLKGLDFDQFVDRVYRKLAEEFGESELLEAAEGEGMARTFTEIDRSIDPNTYVLGANDVLTIYIWGSVSESLTATVDHEGNMIIASVGTVKVGGSTLAEAREFVRNKILEVYKEDEITIVLSQIRRFRAYMLGDVQKPGVYTVNGATRVSDLIEMAGGFAKGDTTRIRGIEIMNESRQTRYADMAVFYHHNDVSKNPYLTEGDRVFVRRRKEIVSIFGEVNYPGVYDHEDGEAVSSLVEAAGGLARDADSARLVVTRFGDDDDSLVHFTLGLDEDGGFALQKDDRVLVCSKVEYRVHRNVWVTGEVTYPGRYPIRKDRTTVRDAIAMAGGFTDDASLAQSMMFRRKSRERRDDEVDVLQNLPLSSLSPVEKAYVKAKFAVKEGMVSIDFAKLYGGEEQLYDLVLRDGDSIAIARRKLTVEVAGAVVVPGHVPYEEGSSHRHYIRHAAGYSSRARRPHTVVVRGGSGVWLRPRDVDEIHEGDVILVPEKEYRAWYTVTRDMLVILSSIAAVITSWVAVSTMLNK
jgi:protein involved in polysaccharide export with SLBB domain